MNSHPFRHGLVIGKLYSLYRGKKFLIEYRQSATGHCDQVTVIAIPSSQANACPD